MNINLDKIKNHEDLKKVELQTIVSALKAYMRNKEYHKTYNARNRELVKKAKELGL